MRFAQKSGDRKPDLPMRKFIFLLSHSLLFALYCLIFTVSGAEAVVVGEVEVKGLHSIGKDELLYLLDMRPGETIDAESVRLGIKRAFLKGIFEDISVETSGGEKTKVTINIKERNFIKDIRVEGHYDISKKTIRELFLLKEDQILPCDILGKAVKDLKPRIAELGYPNADINAEIVKLKEPYRIEIRLVVNTGEPLRIRKVVITGTGEDVRDRMKLSVGDVFNRSVLSKDIDRIKEYYKNNGYFKPVVGPYTFVDGTLSIAVNPGKRLKISITGNEKVSTKSLMKEMPFFEAEDFNTDMVQEASQRMLSVYHSRGYPFAKISPAVSTQDKLVTLNFSILEGVRVEIGRITFTGAGLPEKSLKDIMAVKEGDKYNPDIIDADRQSLQDFYNALGYLSAKVEDFQATYEKDSRTMNIAVTIHEGPKTVIESVFITGTKLVPESEIRTIIKIKPGDIYNEVDIFDARYRVMEFYSTKGFPDTTVTVKKDFTGHKVFLTFQMNEGAMIRFGKVIVTGDYDTKYIVVKRELLQHEGQPFDSSILPKERQKLYKLGIFSGVDTEVLDRYDDRKDVLIKLREGNAGTVDLSAGYGEYDRYRGIVDLSYKNLQGMGRQVSLRLEYSALARRYILQFYEPWFMDIRLPFRAFLLGEAKREINLDNRETLYKLTRHTVTAGFEKKISDSLKAALDYEFSLVNTYDVRPDVVLSKEDTGTLVISGLRPGIIYDTRDDPFNPTKGIFSGISVKFTSPAFLSETDFVKCNLYGNFYHQIMSGLILATSLRGGLAQGYLKTVELPIVERFFLGGGTTVRGYAQDTLGPKGADGNPIGGNSFLMENLELRTSVWKGLGLVTFLDGGNVWVKAEQIRLADLKFTTGLGLRYNTPVGPIRIDYGVKLHREQGESKGELHFSIGNAF
jgi:outer membrane protein insertion porin family